MTQLSINNLNNGTKIIQGKEIQVSLPAAAIKYYRHGWQSWSLTAWTDLAPMPAQKPDIFHPLQIDIEHLDESNPHGSWLGALEFKDGNILLLGALATDGYVSLVQDQLWGSSEAEEIEWFIGYGQEQIVFNSYADELGNRFGRIKKDSVPRIWCSWYSLYTTIDEKILFDTFDGLDDLPFDVLQVDDGWQVAIGDWEVNKKFPSGMEALASKIKSSGKKAGLWFAPLIATKSSQLFREHKDWFLRDENGRFVSAGFNWDERLYALDTTHPDVTTWLVALMQRARSWGFDYLKLDFLYAGAMKGKRFIDMPRERAYRECLILLREAMGTDAFFLACGTPILPTLGVCDAIRIGPDVSHEWEKFRDAILLNNFTVPGTRNGIRTSINRLWLKPLIHIDPDVEYFVSRENNLEEEHKRQLQNLALICNFKATSDLPQWMTPAERESLHEFLNASPEIIQESRYLFQIDQRKVDFTSAVAFPAWPKGIVWLWGRFLGWLGSFIFVLMIFKAFDDAGLRKMRARLEGK